MTTHSLVAANGKRAGKGFLKPISTSDGQKTVFCSLLNAKNAYFDTHTHTHTHTHHYAPDQLMGSVKRDWCTQHLRFCFSRNSKFLCTGVWGLQLTFKGTKFKW